MHEKDSHGIKEARHNMFLSLVDQNMRQADVMSTNHAVANLNDEHIIDITAKSLKLEAYKIVNDVKEREIPRFRYDLPPLLICTTVQQLIKTIYVMANSAPDILYPVRDFKIQDIDVTKLQKMYMIIQKIDKP